MYTHALHEGITYNMIETEISVDVSRHERHHRI